ncbi:MAG: DUF5123 domain-containing protein [Dysgonomonas sp.]
MNKFKNIIYILGLSIMIILPGCSDRDDEITSIDYDRLFSPTELKAKIVNKTGVELNWNANKIAEGYNVEVYDNESFEGTPVKSAQDISVATYTFSGLEGDKIYWARVQAISPNISDSKWSNVPFRTDINSILLPTQIGDVAATEFIIRWPAGSSATKVVLTPASGTAVTYTLTADDISKGVAKVTGLKPATAYTAILHSGNQRIGITSLTTLAEGTIVVNSEDNFVTTLDNAPDGSVLLLKPGEVYLIGSTTYLFGKNLKIMGYEGFEKPIICMSGAASSAVMMGFVGNSSFNYLRFENVKLTGYNNNNSISDTKISYLFNNNTVTDLKELSFKNCDITNWGNTPFRLQGNKSQKIETLTIDGCVINDVAFSSNYAVINVNSTDYINNIVLKNSTVYNFRAGLILRQNATVNSVTIENCTINQGMLDTGSNRFLLDMNASVISGQVTIKNNILGSTGEKAGGARPIDKITSITGNYYTTDYIDAASSNKDKMTSYSGTSTDLWNNPINGIFTFKDTSFSGIDKAGAPRWW